MVASKSPTSPRRASWNRSSTPCRLSRASSFRLQSWDSVQGVSQVHGMASAILAPALATAGQRAGQRLLPGFAPVRTVRLLLWRACVTALPPASGRP